jgi:hypothetical protein
MLHSLCFSSHPSSFHFRKWTKKQSLVWGYFAFGKNIQVWSPHRDKYYKYRIIYTGVVSKSIVFALRQNNSGLFSHVKENEMERTASGVFGVPCYEAYR